MTSTARRLACRAAYPWERSDPRRFRSTGSGTGSFERWRQRTGLTDSDALARYLHHRGLEPAEWIRAFGPVAPATSEALPGEAALETFLDFGNGPLPDRVPRAGDMEDADSLRHRGYDPSAPWPLAEPFRPAFGAAETWLTPWAATGEVHPSAVRGLLAALAREWGGAAHRVLLSSADAGDPPLYAAFPRGGDHASAWRELIDRWPVLGRLLGEGIHRWQAQVAEFLGRLTEDRPALAARFNGGRNPGALVRCRPAGDPHDGGRSVILLEFSCGLELVYKPGVPDGAALYEAIVDGLRADGLELPRTTAARVERDGYRWEERIHARNPASAAERALLCRRLGMQARVLQLLDAGDVFRENVIPGGDRMWLVDLEVLPTPRPAGRRGGVDTPFLSGILTCPVAGQPGLRAMDLGVLAGGPAEGRAPFQLEVPVQRGGRLTLQTEQPRLPHGWTLQPTSGDLEAVRAGWVDVDLRLTRSADDVAAALRADEHRPSRILVRPTHVYERLLRMSVEPRHLEDGRDRGAVLERLWRSWLHAGLSWEAVEAEVRALARMDIPLFHVPMGGRGLHADGKVVQEVWSPEPLGTEILRGLDRAGQEGDAPICSTIYCAVPRASPPVRQSSAHARPATPPDPGREVWIDAAQRLARQVIRDAGPERRPGRGPSWTGLVLQPLSDQWLLVPLDDGLFGGRAGIAVALHELWRRTQEDEIERLLSELVPALVATAGRRLTKSAAHPGPARLGPFFGASAGLYAFARCPEFVDDGCFPPPPSGVVPDDVYDGVALGVLGLELALPDGERPRWEEYLDRLRAGAPRSTPVPPGSRWPRRLPSAHRGAALLASRQGRAAEIPREPRRGTGDLAADLRLGSTEAAERSWRFLNRTREASGAVALERAELGLAAWHVTGEERFLAAALTSGGRLLRDTRDGEPFPRSWASYRHKLGAVGGTSALIVLFSTLATEDLDGFSPRLLEQPSDEDPVDGTNRP